MNSSDTIYIDVEDDISTIIEKVEESAKPGVKLVLPKRSSVLQSTVNMRLLKQSASKVGKELVLVTSDEAVLPLAGAIGLATAKNLQDEASVPPLSESAKQPEPGEPYATAKPVGRDESIKAKSEAEPKSAKPSAATVGALADAQERKDPETVELSDEESDSNKAKKPMKAALLAGGKFSIPNFDRFRKLLIFGGGGLLVLIIFLILAIKVLPKATIAIETDATPVQLNMNLTSSGSAKKLDETNGIIPSSLQTYKQTASKQVTATGKQDVGSKATGTVTVINCYSSNSYSVPSGTAFTADGNNYISTQAVSLTPESVNGGCNKTASSTDISVIAASAGTSYNQGATSYTTSDPQISPNTDNSESSAFYYAISGSSMTGGTSQIVTVVSQQDINTAATALGADAAKTDQSVVTKQFESQLDSQGYYVIDSTLKVSEPSSSSSPAAGQQASSATVTITTTYSVLALEKADLIKLITDYAKKQIDSSKQTIDTSNILSKATIDVASQSSPTDASLTVGGSVNAMPLIDAATVRTDAIGKKKGDIQNQLSSWPGVKSVNVKLSPFWVSTVPSKPSRVVVTIQTISGN